MFHKILSAAGLAAVAAVLVSAQTMPAAAVDARKCRIIAPDNGGAPQLRRERATVK